MDLSTISSKFTKDVLHEIVEKLCKEKVLELNFSVRSATSKGDNYITAVYRVNIEASTNTGRKCDLSLIVKGLPQVLGWRKTFRSAVLSLNEVNFYEKAMEKLLSFQEKKQLAKPFDSIPRSYKSFADGENDYIVLEDLAPEGYQSASRLEALDFTHCKMIFEVLGRFHGLSFAMKDQDPEGFQEVVNSVKEVYYFKENKSWYNNVLLRFIEITQDALAKECPNTIYEEKFNKFSNNLYEHLVDMVKNSSEPYGCLAHGDTWAPNFLFKYDSSGKNPESMKMIDFQIARYSSPAIDLSFFVYSCTTKDLRDNHFEDLLRVYHNSLSEFVRDLGSDPDILFPYTALRSEWTKYGSFGLGVSIESVPLSLADNTEVPDVNTITGDDALPLEKFWIVHPFKDKQGRMRIVDNIKHAVDFGYI